MAYLVWCLISLFCHFICPLLSFIVCCGGLCWGWFFKGLIAPFALCLFY